jgi:hypothetical protein
MMKIWQKLHQAWATQQNQETKTEDKKSDDWVVDAEVESDDNKDNK